MALVTILAQERGTWQGLVAGMGVWGSANTGDPKVSESLVLVLNPLIII